jgi:hypothetical protein
VNYNLIAYLIFLSNASLGKFLYQEISRGQELLDCLTEDYEISLIRLIKIFATILLLQHADLIHWGFLDAF